MFILNGIFLIKIQLKTVSSIDFNMKLLEVSKASQDQPDIM